VLRLCITITTPVPTVVHKDVEEKPTMVKKSLTADDYWPVEKGIGDPTAHPWVSPAVHMPFSEKRKTAYRQRYESHPAVAGALGSMTGHGAKATAGIAGAHLAGNIGGAVAGYHAGKHFSPGAALGGAVGGALAGGAALGAGAGSVVHHHHGESTVIHKSDDLSPVQKCEEVIKDWAQYDKDRKSKGKNAVLESNRGNLYRNTVWDDRFTTKNKNVHWKNAGP
jgi:hypothetical protein